MVAPGIGQCYLPTAGAMKIINLHSIYTEYGGTHVKTCVSNQSVWYNKICLNYLLQFVTLRLQSSITCQASI